MDAVPALVIIIVAAVLIYSFLFRKNFDQWDEEYRQRQKRR